MRVPGLAGTIRQGVGSSGGRGSTWVYMTLGIVQVVGSSLAEVDSTRLCIRFLTQCHQLIKGQLLGSSQQIST